MKCCQPMSQVALDEIKHYAEIDEDGIKNFTEPTEEKLRKKLIYLYDNIESIDVTSKEFIEIEDLILQLSTYFMWDGNNPQSRQFSSHGLGKIGTQWLRKLLISSDEPFDETRSEWLNGLILDDKDVFFLELTPRYVSENYKEPKKHIIHQWNKKAVLII